MRTSSSAPFGEPQSTLDVENSGGKGNGGPGRGKLYAVGLGPGSNALLTPQALAALEKCEFIVGYKTYTDLIREIFPHKQIRAGSMRKEIERCMEAVELARAGEVVAVVSSGDAGIYGMAGLLIETSGGEFEVEIVPGVTAANALAALLGAPLMNDFAVISLSDLLTPRDKIFFRLRKLCEADLVIVLYNPSSKARRPLYEECLDIIGEYRSGDTVAGWGKKIAREGEFFEICTLGEMKEKTINMTSTVIVGNSETWVCQGKMITGRGYDRKMRRERRADGTSQTRAT